LTDFRFQILGEIAPKVKIFENVSGFGAESGNIFENFAFSDQIW